MSAAAVFQALIRRVRERDEGAAADLFRLYEPELKRIVRIRLTSPQLRRLLDSGNMAPDGTPRLIDFGLARQSDVWGIDPVPEGVTGTAVDMAPEQAISRPRQVGQRTDLFALGACCTSC